jgi:Ca-activated chloride channel family protein
MSIDHPLLLVLGAIAAVVLAVWYTRAEARTDAQALRYSNLPFLEKALAPRQWLPKLLRAGWIGALALLVLAISGPHLWLPLPVADGSVFICIDTSGSMASTDVSPTRAQAATAAARAFIEDSPAGVKIGLIAFSSSAELIAPLSADKAATIQALDQIPEPNGATAIGDAMRLAASEFPPTGHRVVVLITDGVNNSGVDPQQMAEYLGAHHVPIYTIGIGTQSGDVIGGEQTTIDESALEGYAAASGGAYARAQNASELRSALARLGRETSIERQNVAAGLGFALAGGGLLAGIVLVGLGMGRLP